MTQLVHLPGALDLDVDGLVWTDRNHAGDVGKFGVEMPATDTMRSPGSDSRLLRRRIRLDLGDDIGPERADEGEEGRKDEDGEQEVRHRPGQHDQEALPHRPELECPLAELGRNLLFGRGNACRVHVADELHIAAERQPSDLPAGAEPVGPAENLVSETDREHFGADVEPARDKIVAELVEEDERADHAHEREQDEPERGGWASISGTSLSSRLQRAAG